MRLLLLLCLLSIGCGSSADSDVNTVSSEPAYNGPIEVDAELAPYINRFTNLTGIAVTDVSVQFDDEPINSWVGQCTKYSNGKRVITIKRLYWNNFTNELYFGYRYQLVYHEIAHCLLNLGHDDNMGDYQGVIRQKSIMNSNNFDINAVPGPGELAYLDALVHNREVF